MAYTAPRTWAIGETPTAAQLNQELRDNQNSLRACNDQCIRVHRTATQSITSSTNTAITWQAAAYQTGVTWSSGTNPTRLTVNVTGLYMIAANIKWANVVGGRRKLMWRPNGGSTIYEVVHQQGNGVDTLNGIDFALLTAGDYIEIVVWQNSGGSVSTSGTTQGDCWAGLHLIATGGPTVPLWKAPRTWADGEILSPALLNTEIRDRTENLRYLKGTGAMVYLEDELSITQEQRDPITWQLANWDVGGVWDGGSKFVAPVDGIYWLMVTVEWDDGGDPTTQGVGFRINGKATSNDTQFQEGVPGGASQNGGDFIFLEAGDYVEFYAWQDDVESLTAHADQDKTRAAVLLWAATA